MTGMGTIEPVSSDARSFRGLGNWVASARLRSNLGCPHTLSRGTAYTLTSTGNNMCHFRCVADSCFTHSDLNTAKGKKHSIRTENEITLTESPISSLGKPCFSEFNPRGKEWKSGSEAGHMGRPRTAKHQWQRGASVAVLLPRVAKGFGRMPVVNCMWQPSRPG